MNKALHKKRMTRAQFESLFAGNWEVVVGVGRVYNRNGKFQTWTDQQYKYLKGRGFKIRGKSWFEIAKSLKLVP